MTYYKNGTITSNPAIANVIAPTHSTIIANGWLEYVNNPPAYDPETHKLIKGDIEQQGDKAIQLYSIEPLTEQELQERKEANTPIEITRWQLREGLRRQGQLATVNAMIATLDEGVQDWWNVSGGNVDRTDAIIQNLADQLEIDVLDFWQYCSTLKVGE